MVDALRAAAQGYIDHYIKQPASIQKQAQNERRKFLCENTCSELRGYALCDEITSLHNPPWDSGTAMKAASLKATMDFESLRPGTRAEVLGGQHAFPAFWVKKASANGAPETTFIFKPKATDLQAHGLPPGGEIAREAAVARLADLLKGATGLDLRVPDTHVVALPRSRFPEEALAKAEKTDPLLGSLQQFARTDGDLRGQKAAVRYRIPAEDCQKLAVLDMLTLNTDRHVGNLLVSDRNGKVSMTPIDHGLAFPASTEVKKIVTNIGDIFNANLSLPGAHEPFSEAVLKCIERIDPDSLAAALKKELAALSKTFPGVGDTITGAQVEMSRRAAMFLKLAAPKLSPAAAEVALGQNAEELFDPGLDDLTFERRVREIVAGAALEQDGLKEYLLLTLAERCEMEATLQANGWEISDKWLLTNAQKAVSLHRGQVRNPVLMNELEGKLGAKTLRELLKTNSLRDVSIFRDRIEKLAPDLSEEDRKKALRALEEAFPLYKYNDDSAAIRKWREFTAVGGRTALDQAIKRLPLDDTATARALNDLDNALRLVGEAAQLPQLDKVTWDRTLDAIAEAFPNDAPDRKNVRACAAAIKVWQELARLEYQGEEGVKAVLRTQTKPGATKFPETIAEAVERVRTAQKVSVLQTDVADRELKALYAVWPGTRRIRRSKSAAPSLT